MANLFRKSALDTMATPEQLDKQVKITTPAAWIVCLAMCVGMVTFILWSFTYQISNGAKMNGVVFTNKDNAQIKAERDCIVTDVLVSSGEYVEIGDVIAIISFDELLEQIEQERYQLNQLEPDSEEYIREKEKLDEMIEKYVASTVIKSNCAGYVQNIVTDGNALERGENIVSIMQESGYNEVVAYVPMQAANNMTLGMKAQISPVYAPREEYGYMTGAVTYIGTVPVTEENIIEKMGTLSYVEGILPNTSFVEVRMKLDIDLDSKNNYQWSNPKGENLPVELGTQCSIIVVTSEYYPIELLLK